MRLRHRRDRRDRRHVRDRCSVHRRPGSYCRRLGPHGSRRVRRPDRHPGSHRPDPDGCGPTGRDADRPDHLGPDDRHGSRGPAPGLGRDGPDDRHDRYQQSDEPSDADAEYHPALGCAYPACGRTGCCPGAGPERAGAESHLKRHCRHWHRRRPERAGAEPKHCRGCSDAEPAGHCSDGPGCYDDRCYGDRSGDSDDRSHGLRDYRDHSHGCRSDRGGRGSACRGVRRPADAVSVHPESEPADVPRQAMPDVRERPESVRKMKWKPGPKVRPGGAAARAWNRPWRCPWRTLPSDAGLPAVQS